MLELCGACCLPHKVQVLTDTHVFSLAGGTCTLQDFEGMIGMFSGTDLPLSITTDTGLLKITFTADGTVQVSNLSTKVQNLPPSQPVISGSHMQGWFAHRHQELCSAYRCV
jgi:hypothetical protein